MLQVPRHWLIAGLCKVIDHIRILKTIAKDFISVIVNQIKNKIHIYKNKNYLLRVTVCKTTRMLTGELLLLPFNDALKKLIFE